MDQPKSKLLRSEDWWSVWVGLFIFGLAALNLSGLDLLGWAAKNTEWIKPANAVAAVSGNWSGIYAPVTVVMTWLFMLGVMSVGARFLGANARDFAVSFSVIFWASFACWTLGHYGYIAATPEVQQKLGLGWSLKLTGEAGLILALLAGLAVGNFFPGLAQKLVAATRPEWYIKTAIVIMGAGLGVKAAASTGLAGAIIFRGFCAIIEAYLIYWALVYFIARKFFGFSREWAAPLASGVSICGVSAAIATGAAIRARPVVPVMVSSLVVVFAVMELILLPFLAQHFLWSEPMVAGAWMGLAVKTDGAAVASGAIVDSLVLAKLEAETGIKYTQGWLLMTATTTKMFIDVFIGIWSFVLAVIWCSRIECKPGQKASRAEIWERFPKFVIGYVVTFALFLAVCLLAPDLASAAKKATGEADVFRKLFFAMTFFSIGLISDFRKLWEEGIGKLAAVYIISLFGFIIWIGLLISWIFFHGIMPPVAAP